MNFNSSPRIVIFPSPSLFLLTAIVIVQAMATAAATSTPENSQDKSVHIIYVDRPESEDPEPFHVRTLASVLGSEEAAKDAIIYHYTHAASGFSAKLTAEQAEQLEKKEEVLQVMQDKVLHVHSGQKPGGGMRTMNM